MHSEPGMTDKDLLRPMFEIGELDMPPPPTGWWSARWRNLERRGFITMKHVLGPDKEDMVRVGLTDAGRALFT